MAEPQRKFYLDGAAPDSVLGISRADPKVLRKDGTIDISKFDAQQMEELERAAATDGNPIREGEPKDIK